MLNTLRLIAFVLLPALLALPASAQTYPSRTVKLIVPFGAGGPADVYARILAQHLSEETKQSFVVEDRPGAGSIIGTDAVAKSAPDGYTLLVMSNTHTTNESLLPNKPFQLMRDFVPVAPINYSDLLMVVHPSVPAKTVKEFIDLAKKDPGKLNYASSGPGTPYHMAGELFKAMSGTDIVHVPHKASGDMRNSVLSGNVQMMFDAITVMSQLAKAGQVRALATSASQAQPAHPRSADGGRDGSRLRVDHLDRRDGAEGHAQGYRHLPQHLDQQGDQQARREGSLAQAGRHSAGEDAGGVRCLSAQGHREVGPCGKGVGSQNSVTNPVVGGLCRPSMPRR